MDKDAERAELRRVFGSAADTAVTHERPDFLLPRASAGLLGVEVTSLYASNPDAKLKLLPGYAMSLIDRTAKVHRADRSHIRVEDVTITHKDGSVVDTVTGLIQELPSPTQSYGLLSAAIAEKEAKIFDYRQACPEVDLIIKDGSNLFRHDTYEDYYRRFHALAPKAQLLSTAFREIHLITITEGQRSVFIPLVANLLFADCYGYMHLIRRQRPRKYHDGRTLFQLLGACLRLEGYGRLRVTSGRDFVGISCGAWEIHYSDAGIALRDWGLQQAAYGGESLDSALSDAPSAVWEAAKELRTARSECFAAMDVRLPTREA